MHHLVYASTASFPFDEFELQRLLERWRATNARFGITGVLLHSEEGNIMQVLEGDAVPVQALFATIAADVRHRSVVLLADGPVAERVFAEWSMQFRAVGEADFSRFAHQLSQASPHVQSVVPLLEAFVAQVP